MHSRLVPRFLYLLYQFVSFALNRSSDLEFLNGAETSNRTPPSAPKPLFGPPLSVNKCCEGAYILQHCEFQRLHWQPSDRKSGTWNPGASQWKPRYLEGADWNHLNQNKWFMIQMVCSSDILSGRCNGDFAERATNQDLRNPAQIAKREQEKPTPGGK